MERCFVLMEAKLSIPNTQFESALGQSVTWPQKYRSGPGVSYASETVWDVFTCFLGAYIRPLAHPFVTSDREDCEELTNYRLCRSVQSKERAA